MIISTILKRKVVTLHLHETKKGGRVCRTTQRFEDKQNVEKLFIRELETSFNNFTLK